MALLMQSLAAFRVSRRRKFSEVLASVAKLMSEISPTHVMRNEIVASKQKSEGCIFDLTSGRGEGSEGEKETHHQSCQAKSVTDRKRGCENGQTDPLDGRTRSRTSFVERMQSVQATRKPRAWANAVESP